MVTWSCLLSSLTVCLRVKANASWTSGIWGQIYELTSLYIVFVVGSFQNTKFGGGKYLNDLVSSMVVNLLLIAPYLPLGKKSLHFAEMLTERVRHCARLSVGTETEDA